jgi:hypothetical protein
LRSLSRDFGFRDGGRRPDRRLGNEDGRGGGCPEGSSLDFTGEGSDKGLDGRGDGLGIRGLNSLDFTGKGLVYRNGGFKHGR